ncbi:aldehyde dehydrogenase family protein [Haladaptatus sp. ZSTT2]|uniref:aldehyde dehydrogenase family protein n=1 Tax=Haladaptatus sp. ZSTT2 TaxID=3120515 RepID=UPI00300ED51B
MEQREITTVSGDTVAIPVADRLYIDGAFVAGETTIPTTNPTTGDHLAELPVASTEQVAKAMTAASRAAEEWQALPFATRAARLELFATILEANADDIAAIDAADNGSSFSKMRDDVEKSVRAIRYYAGLAGELKGETIPTPGETFDFTLREPHGAVVSILPFNHPTMFLVRDLAPALIAGNAITIKPSEYTSLSALYVAHLIDNADCFPDGLVNVLAGEGAVGAALVDHEETAFVSFRGSVKTGRKVMAAAGANLIPSIVELGGKNPAIVFPDADVEQVKDGVVSGMSLAWQGQSCASGSRLLVHEDVYDEVVSGVVERFANTAVGDPFDEDVTMGAIVSEPQYEQVLDYIETTKAEGATCLTGGGPVPDLPGFFVQPTVFEVTPEMTIASEEIFGPVLSVMKWSEYDDVIDLANAVDFGLTASIWTTDLNTAHKTAQSLDAGYVWVNRHGGIYLQTPFGGFKDSGVGKHGGLGGLFVYTREKNVNLDLSGPLAYE